MILPNHYDRRPFVTKVNYEQFIGNTDFSRFYAEPQRDKEYYRRYLPQHGLYKKEEGALDLYRKSIRFHPIDYTQDVRIFITELDNQGFPPRFGSKEFKERQENVRRAWYQLKEDPDVMFAYISTRGLGIRVGFCAAEKIQDDCAYKSTVLYWSREILNRINVPSLKVDIQAAMPEKFWWLPTNKYLFYNKTHKRVDILTEPLDRRIKKWYRQIKCEISQQEISDAG